MRSLKNLYNNHENNKFYDISGVYKNTLSFINAVEKTVDKSLYLPVVNVGKSFITLSDKKIKSISDKIKSRKSLKETESDGLFILEFKSHKPVKIGFIKKTNNERSGAFFPYEHNTHLDLTKYQIYKKDDVKSDENCLVHALKIGGMSDDKLKKVNEVINSEYIKALDVKKMCEKFDFSIKLYSDTRIKNFSSYGTNKNEVYKIGLVSNHYFINDDFFGIHEYGINNYHDIKHLANLSQICGDKKTHPINKSTLSSFNLINLLIKNKDKLLTPLSSCSINNKGGYVSKTDVEPIALEYNNVEDCKLITDEYNKKVERDNNKSDNCISYDNYQKIFIDFEAYVHTCDKHADCIGDDGKLHKDIIDCDDAECGEHKPYLLCAQYDNSDIVESYTSLQCGFKFLCTLKEDTMLLAHNACYDGSFLLKYFIHITEVNNQNDIMLNTAKFFNPKTKKTINIIIKDTYKLIPTKLRDFAYMFPSKNMKIEKEIMPYKLYNKNTIKNRVALISDALKHIHNDNDKKRFIDNIHK